MNREHSTKADVAVGTDLADILEVTKLSGVSVCNIEIENSGDTNAFTDFAVMLKDHSDGEWYTLSSGTDWADESVPWQTRVTDPDPKTLGAGLKSHIQLEIGAAYGIIIQAKSTSETTAQVRISFAGA